MSKYKGFIDVAENIFKDIYPQIAKQIVERSGKNTGIVLEVGCGSAILSRNLSMLGNFYIFALDLEIEMINAAYDFIRKENKHIIPILGNVENIPFRSHTFDLVISRGSMFFWEDKVKAFSEIYRVLKKCGVAYIGGGFGNKQLKQKIESIMLKKNPNWLVDKKNRLNSCNPDNIKKIFKKANICTYRIINDDSGYWLYITKE